MKYFCYFLSNIVDRLIFTSINSVLDIHGIENIDDKEVFKSNHDHHDDHKTHSESSHINTKSHHDHHDDHGHHHIHNYCGHFVPFSMHVLLCHWPRQAASAKTFFSHRFLHIRTVMLS